MSTVEVRTAYRRLFKASLDAIRHSSPAKYVVRDILRRSFREDPQEAFEPTRIDNTLTFLERASKYRGREHKILRNILKVRFHRQQPIKTR
jgi:hypothetical protein